ncbi:hypothetical protein ABL78_5403 [Leptomonas seymouri]|uniref:RecA family profile 1 domain-containing protein n=1 Tax=Leptomonas seymouri TaxID=5684 RepID=A0A0N1PCF4_LEPSE|nr:hypothetical protein ABL78_5403 [Leptomonas seymouri]|eukprot:KPI85522.1 hypothetical protein ABL78_5403 [Leptomonas seymouri]
MSAPLPRAPQDAAHSTAFVRSLPNEAALLAVPDAQLCSCFRVSLASVWRWRAEVSRHCTPPIQPAKTLSADVASNYIDVRHAATTPGPCRLDKAVDLLQPRLTSRPPQPSPTDTVAVPPAQQRALHSSAFTQGEKSTAPLPTSLATLDAALLGGLRRGWITELTGPASSGKTTLATAWCHHNLNEAARTSAVGYDCVWLQSHSTVEAAVLSIATGMGDASAGARVTVEATRDYLQDSMHVACLPDLDALQDLLQLWLDDPSSLRTVGLVVVDSITELVRKSFSYREQDALHRHEALASVLQTLKRIAESRQVAVLVLSQQHALHFPPIRGGGSGGFNDTDENDATARDSSSSYFGFHGKSWTASGVEGDALSSPDVGELGRLFFHSVNVRLQLRAVRRVDATAATWNSPGLSLSATPISTCWQLDILKCPLCAPLSVALQLRVSHSPDRATAQTTQKGHSDADGSRPMLLSVVEAPEQHTALPLRQAEEAGGEVFYASIDPCDYTEPLTFLRVS